MATWQAVGRWAAALAAALLAVPGCSSEPVAPAPIQKAEAPAVATPADEAVPAWAKVSQLQIDSARKAGVPVAKEIDLGGGVTIKLVFIPAGKFMMGEGKDHEVTISKPFYMGVTEVTQAQYEAGMLGMNPSYWKGPTNPVDSVLWAGATNFCKRLSEKTSQAVRLPTAAEWEYACRAGSKTKFYFGDADEGLGDYAWYAANSGGKTHPVAQKKPNAWGLYDMYGNVLEWCADRQAENYLSGMDPRNPTYYSYICGGSCSGGPDYCRSASSSRTNVSFPGVEFGFRVVVSVLAPGP